MTTNTNDEPRTTTVVLRDDADRAVRYFDVAGQLGINRPDAYAVADLALDFDRIADDPILDTLLLLAAASFTSDDDYDDFRDELRAIAGL